MLATHDFTRAAEALVKKLGNQTFLTLSRREITDILRETSGQPNTRMKSLVAMEVESALLKQGLEVYPSLTATEGMDLVRIFPTPSVLSQMFHLINYPGGDNDDRLTKFIATVDRAQSHSTTTQDNSDAVRNKDGSIRKRPGRKPKVAIPA